MEQINSQIDSIDVALDELLEVQRQIGLLSEHAPAEYVSGYEDGFHKALDIVKRAKEA